MKIKTFVAVLLALVLATISYAQPIVTPKGPKSDEINLKIHKLDLLLKILPLALSKDQYKDLLLSIAKARQKERGELEKEDDALEQLDSKISDTLDAALTKGTYPSHEIQDLIASSSTNASLKRVLLTAQVVETLYNDVSKSFNAGQMKVMAGSFDDRYISPTAKKGDLKDDFKQRFFIQEVFLDPYAFDIVSKLESVTTAPPTKG